MFDNFNEHHLSGQGAINEMKLKREISCIASHEKLKSATLYFGI